MDDRLKVLRAISKEDSAIEFRIATDVVIVARIEALSGAVEPRLQRPEDAALKDRTGVARIGAVAKAGAALEDENPSPGRREAGGAGRPTHTRADDQYVDRFWVSHRFLVGFAARARGRSRGRERVQPKRPLIQIRRDVCGSNSTALSRLNAKVWF